jgi:hypothetical protein
MRISIRCISAIALVVLLAAASRAARAHCDGLDGPVVAAAREALRTGDVNLVLVWVRKGDEAQIRDTFAKALAVRKLGPQAKDLADTHFFETLVRVHRAGEGAPYTGLKPAGLDLGPAIPAADQALRTGQVEPIVKLLVEAVRDGVGDRFKEAIALRSYKKSDVETGRKFVASYVVFIHYVERLYEAAKRAPEGHYAEGASPSGARHDER